MYNIKYQCPECNYKWYEIYSSPCDSECPECNLKNIQALTYKHLTKVETMKTVKSIKTLFNFTKKAQRPVLNYIRVDDDGMTATNVAWNIRLHNSYDLKQGFHKVDTLEYNVTSEVEDFPIINEDFVIKDTIKVSVVRLVDLLKYSSKDETRILLNSIAVSRGYLVACDGHTMKSYKIDDHKNDYVLPSDSIKFLIKVAKKFKETTLTLELNEDRLLVSTNDFTFSSHLINREYVKWESVQPKSFTHEITINNAPSFKEIKALLNERSYGVKFEIIEGYVNLKFPEYPDKNMRIGLSSSDLKMDIGLNYSYFERAVGKDKDIQFLFNSELSPLKINGAIIMPLKL